MAAGVPENSLTAVDLAVRARLGVEIDVRLSRDGTAVVFHDARLSRVCGRPGRVSEHEYDELRHLRLAGTDDVIPSLSDVLALVRGAAPVLLDLKCGLRRGERRQLAAAVARAVRGYDGPLGVVSFDPLVLRSVASAAPHLPRGQSAGVPQLGLPASALLLPAMRPVDSYWLNPLSLPHFVTFNVDRLPFASLQTVRDHGAFAVGWTVRARGQLTRLVHDVDNLIVEGAAARECLTPTTDPAYAT